MRIGDPSSSPLAWRLAVPVAAALGVLIGLAIVCPWRGPGEPRAPSPVGPSPAGETPAAPEAAPAYWPPEIQAEEGAWTGRLVRVDPHLALLTVRGTPDQRGTAHGRLLGVEVRALVKSVRAHLCPDEKTADDQRRYAERLEAALGMARYLEPDVAAELRACAAAAGANADELLLAQLFGDINRVKGFATFCSSFAAFGPATAGGKLIVGRNFDYGGFGLEGGLPLILQELPLAPLSADSGTQVAPLSADSGTQRQPSRQDGARPFITVGYAGILNGWTALNADGLVASNNTLFGGVDSLEGLATCFLLRKIVARARTVEEAVALIEQTPRACTTGMLIAGPNAAGAWDARLVEFDARSVAVVAPKDGLVLGTNTRQELVAGELAPSPDPACPRYQALREYLAARAGRLDFDDPEQNPVAAPGVYMSINLHCALLDPAGQRIRLAVATGDGAPAAERPFRTFRVERTRIVQETADRRAP